MLEIPKSSDAEQGSFEGLISHILSELFKLPSADVELDIRKLQFVGAVMQESLPV